MAEAEDSRRKAESEAKSKEEYYKKIIRELEEKLKSSSDVNSYSILMTFLVREGI
jgi:hypothetical protein